MTNLGGTDRLRARLELRRSNAARPHVNRKRRQARGSGKGGRGTARRVAINEQN